MCLMRCEFSSNTNSREAEMKQSDFHSIHELEFGSKTVRSMNIIIIII